MSTRQSIINAIDETIASGGTISIKAVATKIGVSHSLIYNRYPDLKEKIKELKAIQKAEKQASSDRETIASLLGKNNILKQRLEFAKANDDPETIKTLLVHIQQLYSMYDSLLEERNTFAEKLAGKPD